MARDPAFYMVMGSFLLCAAGFHVGIYLRGGPRALIGSLPPVLLLLAIPYWPFGLPASVSVPLGVLLSVALCCWLYRRFRRAMVRPAAAAFAAGLSLSFALLFPFRHWGPACVLWGLTLAGMTMVAAILLGRKLSPR